MQSTEPEASALDFLPEALIREMLDKYEDVTHKVRSQIKEILEKREQVRSCLSDSGLLKNSSEIIHQKSYPTTVGVDGSYVILRQIALDTVAVAAVAVEGLVPPREDRLWEKPHHIVNILPIKHHDKTLALCKGLMFAYELELATRAPHKVTYLDGSLTTQLIALGQAFLSVEQDETLPEEISGLVKSKRKATMLNYIEVLRSSKIGKIYVGVPKYSSRNEVITKLRSDHGLAGPVFEKLNDKGMLTQILKPGEVLGPLKLTRPEDKWHFTGVPDEFEEIKRSVLDALGELHILYFRPSPSHPALRLEIGEEVATSANKLSILLESLEDQARIAGIMEPYPLYIADTFVRQIYGSVAQLKNTTLAEIGGDQAISFGDVFLALHEYRSEGGFE